MVNDPHHISPGPVRLTLTNGRKVRGALGFGDTMPDHMQDKLHHLIETASAAAEALFAKDGRIAAPLWHAVRSDGGQFVLPMPHADKNAAAILVRAVFETANVVSYVMVAEGWRLARQVTQEELAEIERHGIAGHPCAIEAVLFQGEDANEGTVGAYRQIIRPALKSGPGSSGRRRRKARLGPLEFDPVELREREGRMVGMLPVKGIRN